MSNADEHSLTTRDHSRPHLVGPNQPGDPRLAATGTIAGCSVGAVALCLIFARHAPYLAGMVIFGSALAIASVWFWGGRREIGGGSGEQTARLEARINELEERVETAETLERFEDRLAEKEASKRLKTSSSNSGEDGQRQLG